MKVKLMDGTVKTLLVNMTLNITELVDFIGEKIHISNADEYSVQTEDKPGSYLSIYINIYNEFIASFVLSCSYKR